MTKHQAPMTNEATSTKIKVYDLEERTAKFSEEIISFAKLLPNNSINHPLISQIIRSATSIAASYMEADEAFTKKDFRYKIGLALKETKETKYWLRLIAHATLVNESAHNRLAQEAKELNLILASILRNS